MAYCDQMMDIENTIFVFLSKITFDEKNDEEATIW